MEFYDEDDFGQLATESDAMAEFARNVGGERREQAWLLTDYDVWVRNPHYTGPAQRHPEDWDY